MSSSLVGNETAVFSHPMFRDLERAQDGVATLVAHRPQPVNLAYVAIPSARWAAYFDVTGPAQRLAPAEAPATMWPTGRPRPPCSATRTGATASARIPA